MLSSLFYNSKIGCDSVVRFISWLLLVYAEAGIVLNFRSGLSSII